MSRLSLVALLSLAACQKPEPSDAAVTQRAQAAIEPFKAELKGALGKALAESPEKAIDVCAKQAPEIAARAAKPGVVVGRSSQKLRSAANAPRPWLVTVLEDLAKPGAPTSRVVKLPDGKHGYAEAIRIQPPCLTCHGKDLAPNVTAALDARYPDDHARGFALNDFRGVFWAEVTDYPAK